MKHTLLRYIRALHFHDCTRYALVEFEDAANEAREVEEREETSSPSLRPDESEPIS